MAAKSNRPEETRGGQNRPLPEGTEKKGGQNPANTSAVRPPKPGGSGVPVSGSPDKGK